MFTGIITDMGSIKHIELNHSYRIEFITNYSTSKIDIGASIACSGVCLTVIEKGKFWFAVNVSEETLDKTTIKSWIIGQKINLEQSLKVGDELGGHIVYGHVDSCGKIIDSKRIKDSKQLVIEVPSFLSKFIAIKGSITIDGVSLTVNSVLNDCFSINIIPHTANNTSFGEIEIGQRVNVEVDMIARYVARIMGRD